MGYMYLISSQHKLVSRSMSWNTALAMAEAGIEDGLAQINVTFGTNYQPSANTNWTLANRTYGPKTQTLNGGSYSSIILTSNRPPWPSIIATGYASVPFRAEPVQRVVMVDTTNRPAFMVAMAVQQNIDFKGNNVLIDSYDSTDPSHSTTNGLYDATRPLAGGDVCSQNGFVNVQNATIRGKLETGPGGSYSIGNGTVGDLAWNVTGNIEPGYLKNDFNMNFRPVDPPYNSGLPVVPVLVGTNTYILTTGEYYVDGDFILNNNETIYVMGSAKLYVTGNLNMKSASGSWITMAPGASLRLYVGTVDGPPVSAQMTLVNTPGFAGVFQYYGLPSNNSVSWSGNNIYIGTVYAPQADFTAGGGGSTLLDFQGSCVVSNLNLNGHFNFHYDESLRRNGPATGFTVVSWREL
jgi:hypothetical protein